MFQKTLVICWQQVYYNMPQDTVNNFWGIGDLLRGTLSCKQICKQNNFNLVVDTHKHPIGQFLKNSRSEFSEKLDELGDNIHFVESPDIINHLENNLLFANNDIIYMMTNMQCYLPLSEEEKEFAKHLLEPNDDMLRLIQEYTLRLPQNYSIQHYRLGDTMLVRDGSLDFKEYIPILGIICHYYENGDVLLSDSKKFKDYIKTKTTNIIILDTEIGHLGYHKDISKIKYTMLDFFITTKAKSIKSYSINCWGSGFVNWISNIFDIPLIKIS